MKKNAIQELAALHALGALEPEEARVFAALMTERPDIRADVKAFTVVTECLARSLPLRHRPSGLKQRILHRVEHRKARVAAEANIQRLLPESRTGLSFLRQAAGAGWLPLSVPGAFVKLLSFDEASAYAVVLGKLDPGSRYPAHRHRQPEDIFMLNGDLHVGDQVIRAGDFHHAKGGSDHGVNWSQEGCVLLCVLSKEDLLAQLVPS